jgi:hypothetical protein
VAGRRANGYKDGKIDANFTVRACGMVDVRYGY